MNGLRMAERQFNIAMLHWSAIPLNIDQPGGVVQVELSGAQEFSRLGHQVKIFGLQVQGHNPHTYALRTWSTMPKIWQLRFGLLEYGLRTVQADILHGINMPVVARWFPHRALVHYLNHPDDVPLTRYELHRNNYVKAHYAFCSRYIAAEFQRLYPEIPESHCHIVYNGVDTALFSPPASPPIEGNNCAALLFLAAWAPQKGIYTLLEIIRHLDALRPQRDFRWIIAGSTKFWEASPDEARAIDDAVQAVANEIPNVEIIGAVPSYELPAVFSKADLYIAPATWPDPFPLTILDSLACGTPVLATGVGGIPEAIDNGQNGYLFDQPDSRRFAACINDLLDHRNLIAELRTGARRKAESFSNQAHIQRILEVYNQVVANHHS
jgi:glycosyltransferase involved in cell wall biosynthesis